MQQSTSLSQSAAMRIDDVIALLRTGTRNQYNARELDTTVRFKAFY